MNTVTISREEYDRVSKLLNEPESVDGITICSKNKWRTVAIFGDTNETYESVIKDLKCDLEVSKSNTAGVQSDLDTRERSIRNVALRLYRLPKFIKKIFGIDSIIDELDVTAYQDTFVYFN